MRAGTANHDAYEDMTPAEIAQMEAWIMLPETDSGCWEWAGPFVAGHRTPVPIFYIGTTHTVRSAIRLVWRHFNGVLPDHRLRRGCGNGRCVRPDHIVPWVRQQVCPNHPDQRFSDCSICRHEKAVYRKAHWADEAAAYWSDGRPQRTIAP